MQFPTDVNERVSEAVRRYFFGKEERDNAISETQRRKLVWDAKKDRQRKQMADFSLLRRRRLGLAQWKMKHKPRVEERLQELENARVLELMAPPSPGTKTTTVNDSASTAIKTTS